MRDPTIRDGRALNRKLKRLTPEQKAERRSAQIQRSTLARRRAASYLATRHWEEYEQLVLEEKRRIDLERGPLPYAELAEL